MNAQEIRRFVRSYRKFPCPLNKIDVIAQDAHLEEKSQACLIDFAKKMASACQAALNEFEASGKTDDDPNGTILLLYQKLIINKHKSIYLSNINQYYSKSV